MDDLTHALLNFLKLRCDFSKPLLLAFSGGPDSLALLHLMLQLRTTHPIILALAHVNHGWREESHEEAIMITQMAEELGIVCHVKKLNPAILKGNLEMACRKERLEFFSLLSRKFGYQAVLLAHHADDVSETVLKRILEGASLSNLTGIRSETKIDGLTLWRPLLKFPKKEILAWLKNHKLKGFYDETNENTRFLRAKMRSQILPHLSATFGKQVSQNLARLGLDSIELREYLDERVSPYFSSLQKYKFGNFIDLTEALVHFSGLELKYFIRKFCEISNIQLSRDSIQKSADLVLKGTANKQMKTGLNTLYIDRRRLFTFSSWPTPLSQETRRIAENETFYFGQWRGRTEVRRNLEAVTQSNWQSICRGGAEIFLPIGESFELRSPDLRAQYPGNSTLAKWWTDHKIPSFLRKCVPVIYKEGRIYHEFLTGKVAPQLEEKCDKRYSCVYLSLESNFSEERN